MSQLEKFVKLSERDLLNLAQQQNWQGSGADGNPYIIESAQGLPPAFSISNSMLNLSFKNCRLHRIRLKSCQNISFEGVELSGVSLHKCSGINFKNTQFNRGLDLKYSNHIHNENCTIASLDIYRTFESSFKRCSIDAIFSSLSRGNIFEGNEIPEIFLAMLEKESFNKVQLFVPIILLGPFVIALLYFLDFLESNSLLLYALGFVLLILLFAIIAGAVITYSDFKKMKKYPPNEIK